MANESNARRTARPVRDELAGAEARKPSYKPPQVGDEVKVYIKTRTGHRVATVRVDEKRNVAKPVLEKGETVMKHIFTPHGETTFKKRHGIQD